MYEFGWVWHVGQGPIWFAAGREGRDYWKLIISNATPYTNHYYSVIIYSQESPPKVRFRLDGNIVYTDNSAYFPTGYSVWGSERMNLDETNYAHFWDIRKMRYNFTWWPWENHERFNDNDLGYYWYWMSETEGKSIKG